MYVFHHLVFTNLNKLLKLFLIYKKKLFLDMWKNIWLYVMMMKRFILTIERCWDKMKSSCMGYLWHLTWHNCTAFYYLFHLQKCVTKRQKRRRVTKLVHCNKMWWKVEEKNIRYLFTYKKEEKEQYVLNISKHKRYTNLYYT